MKFRNGHWLYKEGVACYYLPAGIWTNYFTGEVREIADGKWFTEDCDYLSIPLWARADSIIPTLPGAARSDAKYRDSLELRVYELGTEASTEVYEERDRKCAVTLAKRGKEITGSVSGGEFAGKCRIRFVNRKLAQALGADLIIDGSDTVLTVNGCGQFRAAIGS